ncbi:MULTISPECIES: CRISPR-associated ring nuclease Csm6 [Vibrio]|uniref:CRISPR-associated ring nuclease Csm6 n=1 Tax=Vibrio TaxID=662 RepID=UPI0020751856|nr:MULTISPECIES: CRISPR-associated ring nuclease Csm6 [Vibrio]USD31268.1 TIGR02584 family CRISPR-associated protein [Vibrio sp. SCSIO 43186]USD44314.1 TIGR02584 family CRISPR-associated protein [Vibrio sp. SCSIO 43145]USD68391.1 TIGR02584 family CRISPR-associated protein [Vibrio sp. SCSIO 43139]USD96077.1 TIGR02584 family CRISPR-associated protein [Vibrio coralliilyticus]
MKNILLAITGASPQVLTETLFAIHQSGRPFPDEIYVITTKSGKPPLVNGLFRDGHLQTMFNEYSMPAVTFDESHIWIIEDGQGNQINDAKSIEDQTYMADYITRRVHELTQREDTAIHASLAGGRKTMAFYFGYAMSLFGREQDTLSHVFVEDEFEFVRDFWYPTKQPKWVTGKNGQGEVDVSKATVTLAEIPFVRQRNSIDESLVLSMATHSFSQTVGMLNACHNEDFSVTVNTKAKFVTVVGVDIKFTAKELAFYLWLLEFGEAGLLVDRGFEQNIQYSESYLKQYGELARDPRVFATFNTTPEDYLDGDFSQLKGMEKEFLQPLCSTINRKLKNALPNDLANILEIKSLSEAHNQRYFITLGKNNCIISQ